MTQNIDLDWNAPHDEEMRLIKTKGLLWAICCILVIGFVAQKVLSSVVRGPQPEVILRNLQSNSANSVYDKAHISSQLGSAIRANKFPSTVDYKTDGESRKVVINYAIDPVYQEKMEKLFRLYQPDHGAFVALDARTGRILAMVSYEREGAQAENLALQATFPAASIFKVVTASAAIDSKKASAETVVPYNGANHTLYKRNVADTKVNRWTRKITMREAFSRSVNTFFGKLGLFYVGPEALMHYAERYQFNKSIRADIPVEMGLVKLKADDPWSVVQAASGFTLNNTMSPLQGALIAATVANDGIMMEPYLVNSLNSESGEKLYEAKAQQESVIMSPESAAEIRILMRETVRNGTSRKAFRPVVRKRQFDEVEMGGKTGSLTGLNPKGKCDWFVGYARYHDQRIAVAALTVNEKKWRVKSSQLASQFLSDYSRQLMKSDP
jgi:cell division protein FtsI/penicillin-binding protein 2